MKFNTKTIHGRQHPDKAYGAVMTPIYQTSTYSIKGSNNSQEYHYSRTHNPTRTALENSFASLENGAYGLAFASGLAAVDAILKLLKPGDEIISTSDLYGGTYRLFTKIFEGFGIKFHFIGMEKASNIEAYLNVNTKLLWVETPTNPMMNIIDIKAISQIAQRHSILLAVDNTFATPYLQRPLELGADIVMHSVTKYLGGHSDLVMGALVVNDKKLADKLYFIQNASGAISGPQDCFLALRGIKTLHVRMERHCFNGEKIARFLKNHSKVKNVYWPGFKDHPGHKIATTQMNGYGGMISFSTTDDTIEGALKLAQKLKIITLAESLGGVESLVGHPATMTHASIPKAERERLGITDSLIRLSVGIEDVDDLIDDLKQALE